MFLVALLVGPTASAGNDFVSLPGHIPAAVGTATDLGAVDATTPLTLQVALRMHDIEGLRSLAQTIDAASGEQPATVLTHAEVVSRFSPSVSEADAVVSWLRALGFSQVQASSDRTLVSVETTVGEANRAFLVSIHDFVVDGAVFKAPTTEPMVPSSIAPFLSSIVGLSDTEVSVHAIYAETEAPDGGELGTYSVGTPGAPPFTPADLRNAYAMAPLLAAYDGTGKHVAITGWGQAIEADFDAFNAQFGLPAANIVVHSQDLNPQCAGPVHVEWNMDTQWVHAMAPGATVHNYCANSATFANLLHMINRVVSDNVADVISQSWGACENNVPAGTKSAYETAFLQASVQGQAFFTSTGDSGSRECTRTNPSNLAINTGFPSTAPHNTAVGGTRLVMSGTSYVSESVWNTCAPCPGNSWSATGGAPSTYFTAPSWQNFPVGQTMRAASDVSAVADPATGAYVRYNNAWYSVGGTSLSAPLWAGYWTDIIDAMGRQGTANIVLWNIANGPFGSQWFRDVTTGNNGDFAAGAGYDYPTGWGSFRGDAPLAACCPGSGFPTPELPTFALLGAGIVGLTLLLRRKK